MEDTTMHDGTVTTATGIDVDAMVLLQTVQQELLTRLDALRDDDKRLRSLFVFSALPSKVVRVDESTWGVPENWFFIGDIHGDFFALSHLLNAIKNCCPDFRIVFLGDMIDRGKYSVECLFLLLSWAEQYPGRIAWIAGNHDIGLYFDEEDRVFRSSVMPAEILDYLNQEDEGSREQRHAIGRLIIRLAAMLPRAILFPDGLLATHGGFPLTDLHEQGLSTTNQEEYLEWLNSDACLQDFTWTRITKYRKRMPNRMSTGCSYGFKDFEAFCGLHPEWFPVKRMITGHEHPEKGWVAFADYVLNPACTIVGFGYDPYYEGPTDMPPYRETLVTARYRRDALPEKIDISYSIDGLKFFYPVHKQETSDASP